MFDKSDCGQSQQQSIPFFAFQLRTEQQNSHSNRIKKCFFKAPFKIELLKTTKSAMFLKRYEARS